MSLGAASGDDLKITISGNDADSALKCIEDLFAKKFSAE
jgi:phosphotransferase system HPr-like phosphotransfer protein